MTVLTEQLAGAAFVPGNILIPGLPTVPGGASTAVWNYLGTDIAHSQNVMPGAPATVQLGSPTYQPAYASGLIGGASPIGFDTGVKDDAKTFTLFYAARHTGAADAQVSVPFANVDNTTAFGVNQTFTGTGNWTSSTNASGINRTLAVVGISNWHLYCVSYDDTARQQSMFNLTDGTQDVFTGTGSRNLSANGNWYIGANPRTIIGTRTCDVAFAALIKNQAINLATAQQYAAHIKAVLAMRGLTVP